MYTYIQINTWTAFPLKNARIYMTYFDAAGRLMLMLCRRSHAEVLHRFCTCGFPDVVHGNTATGRMPAQPCTATACLCRAAGKCRAHAHVRIKRVRHA